VRTLRLLLLLALCAPAVAQRRVSASASVTLILVVPESATLSFPVFQPQVGAPVNISYTTRLAPGHQATVSAEVSNPAFSVDDTWVVAEGESTGTFQITVQSRDFSFASASDDWLFVPPQVKDEPSVLTVNLFVP
jgi:hypothetical protein